MKLVLLSDLHEHLPDLSKLEYDGVIIAGDLSFRPYMDIDGELEFYWNRFFPWIKSLGKNVFTIYGNHDHAGELTPISHIHNCDNLTLASFGNYYKFGLDINALSFTLPFCDWAFNNNEKRLWAMLKNMGHSDMLVSHGPPYGIGDKHGSENLGSKAVLRYIEDYSPTYCIFGHIHSGRGIYRYNNTLCVNVSFVDESYQPINKVYILDTETKEVSEASVTTIVG